MGTSDRGSVGRPRPWPRTSERDSRRAPDRASTSRVASRMRSLVVAGSGCSIAFTFWHNIVKLDRMTELTVRNIRFPIDDTVAFQWQPANPSFGLFGNTFTFLAIAFERYIVSATREALPRFTDADMAEEADLFVRQEAQHARAHRAHAKAMIERYPGLQETYAAANAAYDELLERESTEFHLAYIANLEATFTPLFKMVFDNRHELFEGSDERVGTMLLWHFVEEIEHRSSALRIHHHVTPDPWYRIRKAPKVFDHVAGIYKLVLAGFEEHVPLEDRHISTKVVGPGRPVPLGDARSLRLTTASEPSIHVEPRPGQGPADDALARDQGPDAPT